MAKLFGGGDLFDQVKFALGLGTFIYAVWSIWGSKVGIGKPPWIDDLGGLGNLGGLMGPDYPDVRGTANCDDADNLCSCPNGDQFQMGASRTCADCTAECAKRGGAGPAEVESNVAWFYGRPIRDHGLGWTLSDFGENDPKNRLTVA
jgi:hypothetical protein